MTRIAFLCALLLGSCVSQASAQITVTLGGASTVASANDFATRAFQDPWDMTERTDVGWWLNSVDFPYAGFSSAAFTGGLFTGTVSADPNLWLLETGLPNLPAIGKNGNTFAIDANLHRVVAIRMRVQEPGYMLFLWSTQTMYDAPGLTTAGVIYTTPGWRIYFVDLPSLPLLNGSEPWSGIKRSLRLDPAPDNATAGSVIDIDWIRLVDTQPGLFRTVSWSGGGAVDLYLDNDTTPTSDPNQTLGLLAQNVGGNSYSLHAGALPAGTYYVAVRPTGTNGPFSYSTVAYQVNGAATVTVTSPSDEGSADDFATVQLNNPWDMTSASDIDSAINMTNAGIATVPGAETEGGTPLGSISAFTGTSTLGEFNSAPCSSFAKPVVYPLDPAKRGSAVRIDPNRYRIFTLEMGLPNKARDLCGGSIVRVGWQPAGAPDWTSSWGIPVNSRAGANVVNRITFDMATIPVDAGSPSLAPWTTGSAASPGIAGFRVDPHEFYNPTSFFIKRLKLAAFETANNSYTVRWTSSKAAGTVRVFYDADQDPASKTLIGATGSSSTAGSLVWNTAGLPQGARYYVYVEFDDGININGAYSRWPVVIQNAAGPVVRNPSDFDGDGRSDIVVYRPSSRVWYVRYSSSNFATGQSAGFQWGLPGDLPIAGDVDGDRQADLTVFRPSTSDWLIRYSSQGYAEAAAASYQWGLTGDVPMAADFDGDGRLDLTVYRPSTGQWLIRYSSQGYNVATYGVYQWGVFGDVPLAADFDGDGRTDLSIYRPSSGEWFIRYSSQGYAVGAFIVHQWGLLADVPLVADFDGDRRSDLTVYRPSTNEWFIRLSTLGYDVGAAAAYQWGLPGDTPLVVDLDGDGRTELTVVRPATNDWLVRYSSQGYAVSSAATYQWGLSGDVALPQAFDAIVRAGDFEGDGKGDLTVFRPATGSWFVNQSKTGYDPAAALEFQWGLNGDVPVSRDFDGDRRPDLAVFRPSTAEWFIRYSTTGYNPANPGYVRWGLPGDVPLGADLDGDGRSEIIVFRPSTGEWFILYSTLGFSPGSSGRYQWGLSGDIPIAADFDGDGKGELSVYRPSNGGWLILYSTLGYSAAASGFYQWGLPGDTPVAADFDGDGRTELTVYRPSAGRWFIRYSSHGFSSASAAEYLWGLSDDVPLVRDFDDDGRAELTVYRPSTGQWFVRYSLSGYGGSAAVFQWGLSGDTPVPQR